MIRVCGIAKHTNETKEKLRQSHLGRTASPETRAKMSLAQRTRFQKLRNQLSL